MGNAAEEGPGPPRVALELPQTSASAGDAKSDWSADLQRNKACLHSQDAACGAVLPRGRAAGRSALRWLDTATPWRQIFGPGRAKSGHIGRIVWPNLSGIRADCAV